jgi:hypothetical protein
MTTRLNIGMEGEYLEESKPSPSLHILNLKDLERPKKLKIQKEVPLDLKEEIQVKNQSTPGRICIVGDLPAHKQGLGRIPMIAAALLMVFALNLGQVLFLGETRGNEALALAGEAVDSLKGAGESLLSGEPGSEVVFLNQASELFAEAQGKADFLLSHQSEWLAEPQEVRSLRNLMDAGALMAEVGTHMSTARTALLSVPDEGSLTEYMKTVSSQDLEPAAAKITQINALLQDVDLSGTPYAESFVDYKQKLSALQNIFDLWLAAKEPLLTILGDRYPRHYLILLMNNDEPRLGGGFIGKIGLLELNDGRLTQLEFHDVYEYDNRFFEEIPLPVHELEGLAENWRLRDSNTSIDFPTSAQNAMDFFEKEGGQGVDGVIAIQLSAAQALLEQSGPVLLPSYGKSLDAATFPAVMSTLVEAKVAGATTPKAVLTEFIESFIQTVENDSLAKAKIASIFLDLVRQKQILLYDRDPGVTQLLDSMALSASLPELGTEKEDFLMFAITNMSGNKTERYLRTQLEHKTSILADGTMADSLTITRHHTFTQDTLAWLKQTTASFGFTAWSLTLENLMGAGTNRTGMRIYLPEGSRLVDSTGAALRDDFEFKYDADLDMSYYFLDQSLEAGESKTFTLTYTLPWSKDSSFEEYRFRLIKQPGLANTTLTKTVTAEDDLLLSSEPLATEAIQANTYRWTGPFKTDMDFRLLYH